jgi:hypothetical protein
MDTKIIKYIETLIGKSTQKVTISTYLFSGTGVLETGIFQRLNIPSKFIGHFSNLYKILVLMRIL